MDKFGTAQTLSRLEDTRFLTGQGRYVDDTAPKGALFAAFLRSSVAHAEITELDLDDARAVPGVVGVYASDDLTNAAVKDGMPASLIQNRDGSKGAAPVRPVLAKGRVRFVGEPIAIVVAETPEAARDGVEAILFDFEDLPAHVDVAEGGPDIFPEAPNNLAFDWGLGDEAATMAALDGAAHRFKFEIEDNRIICNSMETRAAWAEWSDDGRVHLCYSGQGVWGQKTAIAKAFGLKPEQVRVTNPDVGGGFGMKAFDYPEYHAVTFAARETGRPVRWMSERTEAMLTDNGGRDLVSTVELGFDANHRLIGYRVDSLCNLGAYNSGFAQFIQTELFSKVYTGVYDIPNAYLGVKGVFTNTTQVDAYRGAGRPEAIYVMERAMDYAARALGVDAWDLRRKNFIPVDAFPYTAASHSVYDIGDFAKVLRRAEATADIAGYSARKQQSMARGKLRGIGLCYYIESILGDPGETAAIEFEEDGTVSYFVGTQSNGQGHETVMSAFLSERTGIPVEQITFVQGDSDRIKNGGGTGGSRSGTVQATATLATVESTVAAFAPFLADALGVDHVDWEEDTGVFRADGSNQTPSLLEAAEMARAAGRTDLLRHEESITLEARSFPNGAHVAEIEIDPETGVTEVVKYTVTDDFGNLLNPTIVAGQIHGGVAQAIGQAITERVVYDAEGQLLTATFMDYCMPRADDVPMIDFVNEPVPTKTNPFGMKGCGEAGTVGGLAAISNAVMDALWERGVQKIDMPFTPHRVWQTLNDRSIAAE